MSTILSGLGLVATGIATIEVLTTTVSKVLIDYESMRALRAIIKSLGDYFGSTLKDLGLALTKIHLVFKDLMHGFLSNFGMLGSIIKLIMDAFPITYIFGGILLFNVILLRFKAIGKMFKGIGKMFDVGSKKQPFVGKLMTESSPVAGVVAASAILSTSIFGVSTSMEALTDNVLSAAAIFLMFAYPMRNLISSTGKLNKAQQNAQKFTYVGRGMAVGQKPPAPSLFAGLSPKTAGLVIAGVMLPFLLQSFDSFEIMVRDTIFEFDSGLVTDLIAVVGLTIIAMRNMGIGLNSLKKGFDYLEMRLRKAFGFKTINQGPLPTPVGPSGRRTRWRLNVAPPPAPPPVDDKKFFQSLLDKLKGIFFVQGYRKCRGARKVCILYRENEHKV